MVHLVDGVERLDALLTVAVHEPLDRRDDGAGDFEPVD